MNALLGKITWEMLAFVLISPFVALGYDAMGRPEFFGAALAIALLCYGILRRLEGKARRLLLAPLGMSAVGIVHQLADLKPTDRVYMENSSKLFFVPLFLFVSMLAAPTLANVSGNVFKYTSLVLLLTGILPGDAYLYFVAVLPVFLFMAMIIALPIDLITIEQGDKAKNAKASRPAPPPISTAPQPHPAI
jgi:p-aminobenzoyl-glutamate transporter AbgT